MTTILLSDAATVVLSVVSAAFIAGRSWGTISATIHTISERLARIEGMFELKLKEPPRG